jgi:PIN domain nuclease of toxin-antitoxin system
MNYLLDTHTFLWSLGQSNSLPERVLKELKNPKNEVYVSAVTFWEISIKTRIKKLDLEGIPLHDLILLAKKIDFQCIDLTSEEANSYVDLKEDTHNDPFDRILIWQCICRNLTMISKDSAFERFKDYGLKLLWE